MVKNLSAVQEMWVQSLGWEDTLEKEMATHSSILVWETPLTKELEGLRSLESQRTGHNFATKQQYACIKNSLCYLIVLKTLTCWLSCI